MTEVQVFETGIPSAVLEKSFGINAKAVKSIQPFFATSARTLQKLYVCLAGSAIGSS